MITRETKEMFVKSGSAEIAKYGSVGILRLDGVPDMLLQATKDRLRSKAKFISGRKSLLKMILKSDSRTAKLADMIDGTCAILLTNEDPFELFQEFKAGTIKLPAKPNQKAPYDISIEPGETTLQPGQAVTELKQAGIDVQIQKGKVVIGKGKVIVKAGDTISNAVSKALHTLDIKPIEAAILP
ncbi:MAG: 50S ribosomal protein L10, partial [Candidatus Micrarchaeaceae archaeon]